MGKRCLGLFALVALLAGCAIGRTMVVRTTEGKPADYQVAEIPTFDGGATVPEEVKRGIPAKIAEILATEKLFAKVAETPGAEAQPTLLLKGQVVQYSPGSRAMRWFTGPLWGVGKGSVIVNIKFIDKRSNALLAESNFEGEIKGGFFGGGIEETHDVIATEIVQFVKTNFAPAPR